MKLDLQNFYWYRSPNRRRLFLVILDAFILVLSIWLSFWLRLGISISPQLLNCLWLFPCIVIISIPLYGFTGQYQGLTKYVASKALYQIAGRNALVILILSAVGMMFQLPLPPRSSWILLWLLLSSFTGVVRFGLRDLLLINLKKNNPRKVSKVAIYGAGSAGAQLASSLRIAGNHTISFFIDDSPELWGRNIAGIPIRPPKSLSKYKNLIDQVLIAIPSLTRKERKYIIERLKSQDIPLLQIPSIEDITSGRAKINSLKPIAIEDLLGRESVLPDPDLLGPGIKDNFICVTGAGGSIGSELCRQIVKLNPSKLVLLEISESSLYLIERELKLLKNNCTEIKSILGNACDEILMIKLFKQELIDIVFHAAAYKHVPIVEENPLSGIYNNVYSTKSICKAAKKAAISKFILISTDKAVRPTNVMGASKRLAELVVQAYADDSKKNNQSSTCFAMVRFGNVLNSSGSVVPIFKEQITNGGPITLTHPEIIRYFMTIEEASQLVLQAGMLALGGDVFLLDMGEPVKILDLAEQMVQLSGLTLKSELEPDGDIEIICTGLRPGEKLFEELLIDAQSQNTSHPLIFRAIEKSLPTKELWEKLDILKVEIEHHNKETSMKLLSSLIPDWQVSKYLDK